MCQEATVRNLHGKLTGSEWGREYVKAVYCYCASLTCMQSTSGEMPGWIKHKLESNLSGVISVTSDMQKIPQLWQGCYQPREIKEPVDEGERAE